jgi:hypothetical protein
MGAAAPKHSTRRFEDTTMAHNLMSKDESGERIELLLADPAGDEEDCAHVFVSVGRDDDERVAHVPVHAFLALVFSWAEALPPEAALDEEGLALLRRVQIRLGFRGDAEAEAEAEAMACELERNGGAP